MEMETEKMRIIFDDGQSYDFPDISYEKFVKYIFANGSSDIEYDKYLYDNNMKELSDFNGEATSEITLVLEQPYRGRVLKFRCVYDSDNDDDFNEVEHFGTDI